MSLTRHIWLRCRLYDVELYRLLQTMLVSRKIWFTSDFWIPACAVMTVFVSDAFVSPVQTGIQ